jgi:hypothetical protein
MGTILLLLGGVLIILGVLSGITLFVKALSDTLRDSNSGTLWALFIICTTVGVIILFNFH